MRTVSIPGSEDGGSSRGTLSALAGGDGDLTSRCTILHFPSVEETKKGPQTWCPPPPEVHMLASCDYGRITLSITCITPLDASISVATTLAASTITPLSLTLMEASLPLTVFADFNFTTSLANTLPDTTW